MHEDLAQVLSPSIRKTQRGGKSPLDRGSTRINAGGSKIKQRGATRHLEKETCNLLSGRQIQKIVTSGTKDVVPEKKRGTRRINAQDVSMITVLNREERKISLAGWKGARMKK